MDIVKPLGLNSKATAYRVYQHYLHEGSAVKVNWASEKTERKRSLRNEKNERKIDSYPASKSVSTTASGSKLRCARNDSATFETAQYGRKSSSQEDFFDGKDLLGPSEMGK